MINKLVVFGLVAGLVVGSQSISADLILPPGTVNLDLMAQNIHDDLSGNAVGYTFAISQNGQLAKTGAGGLARRAVDGALAMSSTRRLQVASVNKTITAVAVLQLLDANNLSIDDPVGPWLPDEWVQGLGVWNGLTFKHLLTHTSGFKQMYEALSPNDQAQWDNDWDGMEFAISNGAMPGASYKYINMNFALFRVIVPALWKASPMNPGIGPILESNYDDLFQVYMQNYVFNPAGVYGVTCLVQATYPAAYGYDVADDDESGHTGNITSDECGGHAGFHLSARNLAAFMAHLRHGALLSPAMRQLMDSQKLGWDPNSNTGTSRAGKYYHGGDWYKPGGREWHTCIMKYPQNVEATLVVNSKITTGKYQCTILKDAFNNAL